MVNIELTDIEPKTTPRDIGDTWTSFSAWAFNSPFPSTDKAAGRVQYWTGSAWADLSGSTPVKLTSGTQGGAIRGQNMPPNIDANSTPHLTWGFEAQTPGTYLIRCFFSRRGSSGSNQYSLTINAQDIKKKKFLRLTDRKRLRTIR